MSYEGPFTLSWVHARCQGPESNLSSSAWRRAEALSPAGFGCLARSCQGRGFGPRPREAQGPPAVPPSNTCPQVMASWDLRVTSAYPSQTHLALLQARAEPGLARKSQVPQHVTLKPHLRVSPKAPEKHSPRCPDALGALHTWLGLGCSDCQLSAASSINQE